MKRIVTTLMSLLVAFSAVLFTGCACEHDYEWVSNETMHAIECKHCGDRQEESVGAHEIEEVQAKKATYTKDGNEKGSKCSICQRILEGCKIIPASTPFRGKRFGDLKYCAYEPEIPKGEKAPLVLYLHGAGERGNDNERQLKHTINKVIYHGSTSPFMGAVVIAPQCPSSITWTGVDHAGGVYLLEPETEILKKVMALVKNIFLTTISIRKEYTLWVFPWAVMRRGILWRGIRTCLRQEYRFAVVAPLIK